MPRRSARANDPTRLHVVAPVAGYRAATDRPSVVSGMRSPAVENSQTRPRAMRRHRHATPGHHQFAHWQCGPIGRRGSRTGSHRTWLAPRTAAAHLRPARRGSHEQLPKDRSIRHQSLAPARRAPRSQTPTGRRRTVQTSAARDFARTAWDDRASEQRSLRERRHRAPRAARLAGTMRGPATNRQPPRTSAATQQRFDCASPVGYRSQWRQE